MADIELAAKKKEEERKRGGVPLVLARGGKGVAKLAQGGSGLGGFGGAGGLGGLGAALGFGGKVGMIMFMTAMGIGAWGVGQYLRPGGADFAPKTHVGADKNAASSYDVDPSSLPSDRARGSGMMVVPESLDGLTPEQRAAAAAAAEAAARAEAERAAKAAEAKAPDAVAAPAVADPAAVAAAGEGDKKGSTFSRKFGALSSLGAGKAGGAQLNGGSGLFGGVGKAFGQRVGGAKGFGSSRSPGRASARIPRGAPGRRAFRQLQNANALSRVGASAATGETAVASADRAFSNNPGADSVVTGAGASPSGGAGGTGSSSMPTNPAGNGPTGGTETPGGAGTTPAPVAQHQNVSPWKMAAMVGGAALLIAGVLLMMAAMVAKPPTPANLAMAKTLAMAALAMGVIATMCGVAILGMGQKMYGAIMTGGGALISVLAFMAMSGYDKAQQELTAATNGATQQTGAAVAGKPAGVPTNLSAPPPAAQAPPPAPAPAGPQVGGFGPTPHSSVPQVPQNPVA